MNTTLTIQPSVAFSDEESANAFAALATDRNAKVARRQNLTGDQATWIVLANITLTALPHLLAFLKDRRDNGKVKKFVIPGVCEIENPTPSQVDELMAILRDKYPQK
jgi:hypothetical protein